MVSTLPAEARTLLAHMTVNDREIKKLIKQNGENLDPVFACRIKNEFLDKSPHKDDWPYNEVTVDCVMLLVTAKAYSKGYEDALRQYSDIVKREIKKATEGVTA